MKAMKAIFIFAALLSQLAPSACSRPSSPTSSSGQPTPTVAQVESGPMELTSIELHKVKLDYPHKFRDKDGKEKAFENAWVVLLHLKNRGPVRDMATDFFIGDYRIPEYGGFKDGIYFRIYDESRLQSLDDKEISVSVAGEKMRSLGKKFYTQTYKTLPMEPESSILKR